MRLKIIRNRPRFPNGGNVQQVNSGAVATSNPSDVGLFNTFQSLLSGYLPTDVTIEEEDGSEINPFKTLYAQDQTMAPDISGYNQYMADNRSGRSKAAAGASDMIIADIEREYTDKRSQDRNPLDPMTLPYYTPDMTGRMDMLGRSIGRAGVFGEMREGATDEQKAAANVAQGANIAQGVFSAASLGLGMYREIAGAASEERARMKDLAGRKERLRQERVNSFVRFEKEGGGVNIGNGNKFDTSDLTGEYIFPLPKSMEDQANVEIEKGEYALLPDVEGPMEAKGERHENGGTPVALEEAYIISDYRKVPEEFASKIRDQYGIKATEKDTYATLLDRYKKKIGLEDKYSEQEKVYKKLNKNKEVKDRNTSELNKSILSKYISENQEEIDSLEEQFRSFANIVYNAQEKSKRGEDMDDLFRKGGPIDIRKVEKTASAMGVSVSQAKDWIYDKYVSERRLFAVGGPTEEDKERSKKLAELFKAEWNRGLKMTVHDVEGTDSFINPGTSILDNQGFQPRKGKTYGRVSSDSLNNLLKVNKWASPLNNGDFNTEGFQTQYNKNLNFLYELAGTGVIANADDARKFRDEYGFWGQQNGKYDKGDEAAYNSNSPDGKYGQTTASKGYYGLDVLTPDQKQQLNKIGVTNYVDLFGDNADKAKEILKDDYDKFKKIYDSGINPDLDFVLDAYVDEEEAKADVPIEDSTDTAVETDTDTDTDTDTEEQRVEYEDPGIAKGTFNTMSAVFPEVLRPRSSGIITEGMERYEAPRIDPVLQSADQYISELNRVTSTQMDMLGEVPDSQRSAILSNLNAVAGENIAKYISQVNFANAQQINEADRFNEMSFAQTQAQNIAERKNYQASTLKAMAISDENLARYYDSINNEIQQKFNVQTSLNTLAAIAPDMRMLPNGTIVFNQGRNNVVTPGDWSTAYLKSLEASETKKKGR